MQRGQLLESQAIFGLCLFRLAALVHRDTTGVSFSAGKICKILTVLEEILAGEPWDTHIVKQVVHKSIVIFNIKRKQGFQFTFFLWSLTLRHKWWIVKNISLFCRSFTWWQHGLCEVPIWRDARHWKSHRTQNLAWQWKVRMIGYCINTSLHYFSKMYFDCWNDLKETPPFAQVSLPWANGAQAEREIFQLQWRRLQVSHLQFLICILSFLIFAISIIWNDVTLQCQGHGWASLVQVEIMKSKVW